MAEATCAAVVASLTDDGIDTATSIGVVPFEAGRVTIERAREHRANAQARLLSGRVKRFDAIHIDGARVTIDVATHVDGEPIELIEVRFVALDKRPAYNSALSRQRAAGGRHDRHPRPV